MTTNQKISLQLLTKIAAGMSVREAFNVVLGAGAFEKLAGDVYDALKVGA